MLRQEEGMCVKVVLVCLCACVFVCVWVCLCTEGDYNGVGGGGMWQAQDTRIFSILSYFCKHGQRGLKQKQTWLILARSSLEHPGFPNASSTLNPLYLRLYSLPNPPSYAINKLYSTLYLSSYGRNLRGKGCLGTGLPRPPSTVIIPGSIKHILAPFYKAQQLLCKQRCRLSAA